ncbi:competence type IV pilus major pilin ComGC [Verrucomicrobiota bacterium]
MKKKSGFTLVEIMIVVATISLLAAMALPSFVKARNKAIQNTCISNLRQVDSSKEQVAMVLRWPDGQATDSGTYRTAVNEYIKNGEHFCPGNNGTYSYNAISVDPACGFSGAAIHQLD